MALPHSLMADEGDSGKHNERQTDEAQRNELLRTFLSEFVAITPGEGRFPKSFLMGSDDGPESERPAHKVTFEYHFSMAKYEVPQNLYETIMGKNPSRWKGPRNSVEMMTWAEANEFCRKVTELLRETELLDETEEIRLPTEAEWEYCCRAGTTTAYSFGDEARKPGDEENKASLLDEYAWHTGNAAGNDPPVGALKPNPWGLYDVHGYLWEFVLDDWHPHYEGAPADGRAWINANGVESDADEKQQQADEDSVSRRVIRGGSWRNRYDLLRSATRIAVPPEVKSDAIGFRCVKAPVKNVGKK